MATLNEKLSSVEQQLLRDKRNLSILATDYQLPHQIILVPDCADIIRFLHIASYEEPLEDAYAEAIKRYFLDESRQLVFIPSWAFEFLNYLHRVVHHNIARFTRAGGFEAFLSAYPVAKEFYQLWSEKQVCERDQTLPETGRLEPDRWSS